MTFSLEAVCPFQVHVVLWLMSILTAMFCMRVQSPPAKCFVRGSYPSSLCAMPIGLRSLCSCRVPYLHSWVLSFHPLGRQRSLFTIATRRDGVILSPCQVGAKPLNGLRTGHSSSISAFWAGNCCLRHPFSPVLKPR